MAAEGPDRISKQERRQARVRSARQRRLKTRLRRAAVASGVLLLPALVAFECSGPREIAEAEVIETRRWRHATQQGAHPHLRATLRIEGLSEAKIQRADGMQRGQRVRVWIRRGRITGRARFLELALPGDSAE